MSAQNSKASKATLSFADTIAIERREVVATVRSDDQGEHPMLRAAYMAASDYIAENLNDTIAIELEWQYAGMTFKASADPDHR